MLELGSSNYNYIASYYDKNGRTIQTQQAKLSGPLSCVGESTIQYSYKGTVLRSFALSVKYGGNSETHTVLTKYNYDHVGRVLSTIKNIDNLGDKTINQFTYKETGQVDTKTVGANLRNESFSYNMQGMLTAINAPYVNQTNNNSKAYFGEILSYAHGFTTNQYNGGIAGVQWKNAGDSTARAYGYSYDNVGRLTNADFTQQNSGATAWTNDKVDYTVSGLSYDAGGNILTMQQKGLLSVGGNATIDNLSYNYFANSNRLQKVTDFSPFVGGLGDFKDSTTTADDYTYDTNGNIVKDNNRNMQGAVFNLLDKPDSMAIAGKSCTYYTYDAAGSTLCKTVKDYKTNTVKRYTYIGGFVYTSNYLIGAAPAPDSLQYAMFEEGRIRWKAPAVVGGPSTVVFDYMIKDHAGNVRTVLTDEARRDDYPMASMETTPASSSAAEEAIFAGLNQTRTPKAGISGYPADNTTTPNDFVAKVQATAGSQKVGPSITLKVMKGDTVNIKVSSWYKLNGTNPTTPQSPLVDIVNALISGVSGSAAVNTHNVTTSQLTTNNAFTPDITQFLTNQSNSNYNTAKPKAYLNWIYFDEQFNIVSSSSGAEQVGNDQQFKLHVQQTVATKCGFLYVYVSNETPNVPVYFDNLQVSHARSPLLETNEYYPYGLKMASISYKASMTMTNRYGWNGGNEYEDEGELNYSNTFYRKYDAQIGRFTGVDMLAEEFAGINPYQFGGNNPVMFNDPMGDQPGDGLGRSQKGPDGNYHVAWVTEMLWSNIGFFDWRNQGGGSGNYSNIEGYTSDAILSHMKFGSQFGINKKGEYGFWSRYNFDPTDRGFKNEAGDGNKLDEVSVGSGKTWTLWGSVKNFYCNYADPAMVWINRNINPITSFVEFASGKEYDETGHFTNEKSRVTSGSQSVINALPFGRIVGSGGRVIVNATVNKSVTMTADQIALKTLVNEATLGGRKALSQSEANAAMQMAAEVNYPGFRASVLDLITTNNHWIGGPHFHMPGIGSGHIPIIFP